MFRSAPLLEFRHHHQFSLHHLQLLLQHKDYVSLENMLVLVRKCVLWGTERCSLCSQSLQLLQRCFMKILESENPRKLARLDTQRMSSQAGGIDWSGYESCSPSWSDHDLSPQPRPRRTLQPGPGCWGWKSQGQKQAVAASGTTSCHLHSVPHKRQLLNTDAESGMGQRSKESVELIDAKTDKKSLMLLG